MTRTCRTKCCCQSASYQLLLMSSASAQVLPIRPGGRSVKWLWMAVSVLFSTSCYVWMLSFLTWIGTGTWLVDSGGLSSFISASSVIILLLSIFSSSWARWTQALCSGFWSRSVWWARSRGVQSQKLLLQLVVFQYVYRHLVYTFSTSLHTGQPQLGSRFRNSLYCDGLCTVCFPSWN